MEIGLGSQDATCISAAPGKRKRIFAATAVMRVLGPALLLLALAAGGPGKAAPQARPDDWAGVYRYQFDNGLVSGERYRSENILEIVDYSPTAAYIRLELEFFNGHQCSLWGIADRVAATLVYRGDSIVSDKPCVLTLRREGGKVVLADRDGVCAMGGCGARGRFEGASFPAASRRPIRYLGRLKAAKEYKQAVAAYAKR